MSTDSRPLFQVFYIQMLLYTITRFFVRASIILFYLRVFPPRDDNKLGRILQFTMVFNVVYNLSFLMAVIFQCFPISDFWTQWSGEHEGHCGNANILAWVAAATGIVFDLWLLALPFPQLLALNLHWKKKLMGGMMFFVGVAYVVLVFQRCWKGDVLTDLDRVMIISLVRLKTINEFTRAVNPTSTQPPRLTPPHDLDTDFLGRGYRSSLPVVRHRTRRGCHLPVSPVLPPAPAQAASQRDRHLGPVRDGPHVKPDGRDAERYPEESWRQRGARGRENCRGKHHRHQVRQQRLERWEELCQCHRVSGGESISRGG